MKAILSSVSKEDLQKLTNEWLYSTTYKLLDNGVVTWKEGEVKENMIWKQERKRFKLYQI